jgi:hypothetical protein
MNIDPKRDAELILEKLRLTKNEPSVSNQRDIALDAAMRTAFDAAKGEDYRRFGSALIDLLDIHSSGGGLDS